MVYKIAVVWREITDWSNEIQSRISFDTQLEIALYKPIIDRCKAKLIQIRITFATDLKNVLIP